MPQLDNPRHERFANEVAKGKKGAEAYRTVYGQDLKNPRGQASDLIRDNKDISERIKELQALGTSEDVMTLREELEYLTRAILTPLDQIDESSVLCQRAKYSETGRELWMVDKLRALELLARLKGELKDGGNVSVAVGVQVHTQLSEPERVELMRKKRQAIERRKQLRLGGNGQAGVQTPESDSSKQ